MENPTRDDRTVDQLAPQEGDSAEVLQAKLEEALLKLSRAAVVARSLRERLDTAHEQVAKMRREQSATAKSNSGDAA